MENRQTLIDGYNRSAQEYDRTAGMLYLSALWSLLPFVRTSRSPAVLDVGCGTGINLLEIARVLGPCPKLVGIDISPGMLDVARRKATLMRLPATFEVGDGESLRFGDESFDLIVCNSAFHWFHNREQALTGFGRILRPGGQLLLATMATPAYSEWNELVQAAWARVKGSGTAPWVPEMPSPEELMKGVAKAGLSVEHFKYQVQPMLVRDVPTFLSSLAVIAPNWLDPRAPQDNTRIVEALTEALTSVLPSGFKCTHAFIDLVARRPAAG